MRHPFDGNVEINIAVGQHEPKKKITANEFDFSLTHLIAGHKSGGKTA